MLCPLGCLWVLDAVLQPVYIMTRCLMLYCNMYILNISQDSCETLRDSLDTKKWAGDIKTWLGDTKK